MGFSTDAILFFGLVAEDDSDSLFPLNKDYYDCMSAWNKENEIKIECGHHCSSDCGIEYIALDAHHYRSWRGDATKIEPTHMFPTDEQIAALKQFCKDNGVEWRSPRWYLVSYCG